MHHPLELLCLVDGENTSNAFPVEIESAETIGDLKELIIKNTVTFTNVDAKDITLWRASIPNNMLNTAIKLNDLDDKTGLTNPRARLSTLFAENPDDETYILVQRPPPQFAPSKRLTLAQAFPNGTYSSGSRRREGVRT